MKNWLNRFALWILRKTGEWDRILQYLSSMLFKSFELEQKRKESELTEYTKRAIELVRGVDIIKTSGEGKRHHVYARLIKEYPEIPKRDLALSIEIGVQKL